MEAIRGCALGGRSARNPAAPDSWPSSLGSRRSRGGRSTACSRARARCSGGCGARREGFAPHPMRCSALVPVPPLLRTPRARLVPRLERHESGAHPDRGQSDGPARSRESPPCLLRSRDARSEPAPCSSQFTMLTLACRRLRLADPKQGGARGAAAASCGLGLKLRMPRVGAAPMSPPPLHAPSKTLSEHTWSREKLMWCRWRWLASST